jgi:hypothetical protein
MIKTLVDVISYYVAASAILKFLELVPLKPSSAAGGLDVNLIMLLFNLDIMYHVRG